MPKSIDTPEALNLAERVLQGFHQPDTADAHRFAASLLAEHQEVVSLKVANAVLERRYQDEWTAERLRTKERDEANAARRTAETGVRTAVIAFYEAVNKRAEADMLAGRPVTGAHHRALEAEIVNWRQPE